MRVLLVEDDAMIGEALAVALKDEAYAVDWVQDGATAELALGAGDHQIVLLDLGLPRCDGLEVLRRLRQQGRTVPVLIITARDAVQLRIKGLDLGADDYLPKPFDIGELLARMRAVIRRHGGQATPALGNGEISLDPKTREVRRGDAVHVLSAREFALLHALLLRPGVILTRAELEDRIYGWNEEVESNAVDFLIHGIRKKLGADAIKNVRGAGWMVSKPFMRRSLQGRLSAMLALCIVLSGLLAALASFGLAYSDAQELQDDTLRQIAALTAQGLLKPATSNEIIRESASGNPESRVTIIRLGQEPRPPWLPEGLSAGLHTLDGGAARMRVFVRDLATGERVVTAQTTDVRDEIAIDSALRTLVPLLLLLPLLVWLTSRVVRRLLAPVRRLAESLDRQSPDRPQPLPDEDVPVEIAAFIHAINRLLKRINQLIGEQRRFVADAAHELRSPLTALAVQAENVERAGSLEAMRGRVAPLRAGIDRARHLTEQLLTLARTQIASSESVVVDVSQLVRALIADYLPAAEARGIDLGLADAASPKILAAPDILRLVLKNGLDNALRHTSAPGEVTIRLSESATDAIIEIIDAGPGIPLVEREQVFAPFHRMEGATGEGSGLGLAIARDAATRLGGTLSLHDRPDGHGLVFRYVQRAIKHAVPAC